MAFLYLSEEICTEIAHVFQIDLPHEIDLVSAYLVHYLTSLPPDAPFFTWYEKITGLDRKKLVMLRFYEKHLLAAANGIDMRVVTFPSDSEDLDRVIQCLFFYEDLTRLPSEMVEKSKQIEGKLKKVVHLLSYSAKLFLLSRLLTEEFLPILEEKEIEFIIIKRDLSLLSHSAIQDRLQFYQTLQTHPKTKGVLDTFFQFAYPIDWIRVYKEKKPYHSALPILFAVEDGTVSLTSVKQTYGLIVPFEIQSEEDEMTYILTTLTFYEPILCRTEPRLSPTVLKSLPSKEFEQYLTRLTDWEIFQTVGIVNHVSREDLLRKAVRRVDQVNFFFPIRHPSYCRNRETTDLTDVFDPAALIIGFGTAFSYVAYSGEELCTAFQSSGDNAGRFRRPDNPDINFTNDEVSHLQFFCHQYSLTFSVLHQVLQEIERLILFHAKADMSETQLAIIVARLSPAEKEELKACLLLVFQTGMYMRQWKGPGHPYPVREKDTNGLSRSHYSENLLSQIVVHTTALNERLNTLSHPVRCIVDQLYIYDHVASRHFQSKIKLVEQWQEIRTGNWCIRASSSNLISTGYHYLLTFFGYLDPEFRIEDLRYVS